MAILATTEINSMAKAAFSCISGQNMPSRNTETMPQIATNPIFLHQLEGAFHIADKRFGQKHGNGHGNDRADTPDKNIMAFQPLF